MKKLFSILAIATLLSCSNDNDTPQEDCNCGIVTKRTQLSSQVGNYLYEIKNNCSGQTETLVTWDVYNVGQEVCN